MTKKSTKKSNKPPSLSGSSTHLSISHGIASVTTTVKKHIKTLAHPFKKAKQALSTCLASSVTIIIDDDSTKGSPALADPSDSSEVEATNVDPEKELSKCCFCSLLMPLLIALIRTSEEDLVLTHLHAVFLSWMFLFNTTKAISCIFSLVLLSSVKQRLVELGIFRTPKTNLQPAISSTMPSTALEQKLSTT
jgi:hypothetical protein